jgi:hypothetical protein
VRPTDTQLGLLRFLRDAAATPVLGSQLPIGFTANLVNRVRCGGLVREFTTSAGKAYDLSDQGHAALAEAEAPVTFPTQDPRP